MAGSIADILESWAKKGIDGYVTDGANHITLNKIVVPEGVRGSGVGSSAVQELLDYADGVGKHVALTPSTDFGGSSERRLREFYKRLGFKDNKGKNKDFSINESMYRGGLPYAIAGGGLMSALSPSDAAAIESIRQKDAPLEEAWNPVEAFGGGLGGGLRAALAGIIPDGVTDWAINGLMSGGK